MRDVWISVARLAWSVQHYHSQCHHQLLFRTSHTKML